MDMVRIKVIIDGKVKYFAHKDKDGNIFYRTRKVMVFLWKRLNVKICFLK